MNLYSRSTPVRIRCQPSRRRRGGWQRHAPRVQAPPQPSLQLSCPLASTPMVAEVLSFVVV